MPTIVFQVNLESTNKLKDRQPYTSDEATNIPNIRSTFFPNFIRDNRKLKHGDQITVSGLDALYLRDNYTTGVFKFLDVVSTTP